MTGERATAQRILSVLLDPTRRGPELPYEFAMVYAGLGDRDAAFRWLDQGYQIRYAIMGWVRSDPSFAPLHSDPRWLPLLRRMGLVP
jgi:hypothetical protein